MSARVLDDCCTRCACGRICCDNKGTSDCGHADEATCPSCCAAGHRRCWRISDHEPHTWVGLYFPEGRLHGCSAPTRRLYLCSGEVVIEGGHQEVMA